MKVSQTVIKNCKCVLRSCCCACNWHWWHGFCVSRRTSQLMFHSERKLLRTLLLVRPVPPYVTVIDVTYFSLSRTFYYILFAPTFRKKALFVLSSGILSNTFRVLVLVRTRDDKKHSDIICIRSLNN